jgi:hypothetical protein
MTDSALFMIDRDRLIPQPVTRGGWSDDAQHGSPPCGALARAIEAVPASTPMQVVRFTVDLFRAVPLRPLEVHTELVRDGRRIQVVDARLYSDNIEVGRARALKVRTTELDTDELRGTVGDDDPPYPGPEELEPLDWRGIFGEGDELSRFHTDGVEIRTIDDTFIRPVPGESWFRLRQDLLPDEELTPFQRLATMSDLANGNSQALDPLKWLFVNPDITVYVYRYPRGEWIGMRSMVHQGRHGIGVTETAVYDRDGRVGHISQAQILDLR